MYINLLIFSPSVTLFKLRRMHTEKIITSLRIIIRKQFSVFHARFGPFARKTTFWIYSPVSDPVGVYPYIMRFTRFGFYQVHVSFNGLVEKIYGLI